MSKDEREFLDALRKRSVEAAAEILEGVQRLKALYEDVTDDGSGTPLPKAKLGDHLYQLAKFELEHASNLIRLGNSQAEMIYEHVRAIARRTQKTAAPAVLEVVPQEGGLCRARFEVKNPFDQDGDLRFEIAPLRKADGEETGVKLAVRARNGTGRVRPHDTLGIDLEAEPPPETLFGDLKVFLLADVERQVAHRVIKVRPRSEAT